MHDEREHCGNNENRDDEKGDRPRAICGHCIAGAGFIQCARRVERTQQVGDAVAKHLCGEEKGRGRGMGEIIRRATRQINTRKEKFRGERRMKALERI